MSRLHRNLWLLATTAFAVCLTIIALSYIVTEPWRIIPDIGGDGAKNNLTYLYHSMYGSGYWFQGMNYPYGEHIVFTDGIPLLSVLFASVGNVSAPVALSVLWWLIGLTYVLSIVFVFKILLRLKIPPFWSLVFSGLIGMLTPQMICIQGHYALSLMCVVPMLFYWTMVYHEEQKIKYCFYISIMGLLAAFIHPYFAGMVLIWSGAYMVWYLAITRGAARHKIKHSLTLVFSAAFVPVVVMLAMKLTDPVTDRPVTPYNPLDSYTNIPQIISSYFSPFWKFAVNKSLIRTASNGGEGFCYIGLVSLVTALLAFCGYLYRSVIRKTKIPPSPGAFPAIWLWLGGSVLVFSMGIPFIWHMQWLMEYLFVFKQFRALGRFSLIFYYVITIYSVVVMYGWFSRLMANGKKLIAFGLLCVAVCTWSVEAIGYMRTTRKLSRSAAYNYDMIFSTYEQNWKDFLREHNRNADDFQAILLLKYFNVGTEKIWVGDPGWLITLGSKAALQLHLPIIDVMMSRSSWQLAQKQVKMVAGPFAAKPMLTDLKANKPFLLLEYSLDPLSPDQAYLLQASEKIGEHLDCRVYACYPDRILKNDLALHDSVSHILPFLNNGDTSINKTGTVYSNHFDDQQTENIFWGSGAIAAMKEDSGVIAEIPVTAGNDHQMYEFSTWFLLDKKDYRSPKIYMQLYDSNGKTLTVITVNTTESVDSRDLWFRASKYFYMPAECRSIKCILENTPNPAYKAMDEMLLRPAGTLVISRHSNGTVLVNNHWFVKDK